MGQRRRVPATGAASRGRRRRARVLPGCELRDAVAGPGAPRQAGGGRPAGRSSPREGGKAALLLRPLAGAAFVLEPAW